MYGGPVSKVIYKSNNFVEKYFKEGNWFKIRCKDTKNEVVWKEITGEDLESGEFVLKYEMSSDKVKQFRTNEKVQAAL